MPFYEYACSNCGTVTAVLQRVDEREQTYQYPCHCGCSSHDRIMSATPGKVSKPATEDTK